jgi:hypothetical protein
MQVCEENALYFIEGNCPLPETGDAAITHIHNKQTIAGAN